MRPQKKASVELITQKGFWLQCHTNYDNKVSLANIHVFKPEPLECGMLEHDIMAPLQVHRFPEGFMILGAQHGFQEGYDLGLNMMKLGGRIMIS